MKKLILAISMFVFIGVISTGIAKAALTRNYCSYETATKNSSATAYSNSTGTNTWYVFWGATSTQGTLGARVEGYYQGAYTNVLGGYLSVNYNQSAWDSVHDYTYTMKIFRVALVNSGARGTGWIQGQE